MNKILFDSQAIKLIKKYVIVVAIVSVIVIPAFNLLEGIVLSPSLFPAKAFAQEESKIPAWVRNIFVWYGQKQISEDELLGGIKFLVQKDIIKVEATQSSSSMPAMNSMSSQSGGSMNMGSMSGMGAMSGNTPFNPNVPIVMPMLEGYYNGNRIFFIHTEASDSDTAKMMANMINFPVLQTDGLKNIPQDKLGKVYFFTNGVHESDPYGGGAYMFQLDIFDSAPSDPNYSQFRAAELVTWNDGSTPRILKSTDDILKAEADRQLTIKSAGYIMNMPIIAWQASDGSHNTSEIDKIFLNMPRYKGEIENIDEGHYVVTIKLQPDNG